MLNVGPKTRCWLQDLDNVLGLTCIAFVLPDGVSVPQKLPIEPLVDEFARCWNIAVPNMVFISPLPKYPRV